MVQEKYETFSESEENILSHFVTNTSSSIFVLRNLPEVIKGALFSRYSRSNLGLRQLLLKEFISNSEESGFDKMVSSIKEKAENEFLAIQKAQDFYDRILDGYGDDSIGELGGAHLAIEKISMLAAKELEDCRIGGSPLEKSTRYVYFDKKVDGEYQFYKEPILMTSAYRDLYIETCQTLFETYSSLIPPLTEQFEQEMPHDGNGSKAAYTAALRAKVLDCLRGLLPAGALTNMGIFGNGRFYEQLIHKMHISPLAEMQGIGKASFEELAKVIPSFVRRSSQNHYTHEEYARFKEAMNIELAAVAAQQKNFEKRTMEKGARLVSFDQDAVIKVAAALLYSHSDRALDDLMEYCQGLSHEELQCILEAGCSARENRRHKSPRALEHASFTFEVLTDFGAYRDLHRHRTLTQERQLLSCDYGYFTPPQIEGTAMEAPYHKAMKQAKRAYDTIAQELPEEAQYIVPMAYNIRWYFHVNLRALQWMCELRSQPAGHEAYRLIAQQMAEQVCHAIPAFECYFKFVNYDVQDFGRLEQERRKEAKKALLQAEN